MDKKEVKVVHPLQPRLDAGFETSMERVRLETIKATD